MASVTAICSAVSAVFRFMRGAVASLRARHSCAELFDPALAPFDDFLACSARTHLEDEERILRQKWNEFAVFNVALERRHVVATGPLGVVQMTADEPRRDLLHPFDMVEKAEIVLHLHVAEIVPVADVRNIEFLEHFELSLIHISEPTRLLSI